MKKSILLLFAALLPFVASAQTKVEIDGIWYNLTAETREAEVTFKGDDPFQSMWYSGSITIPATVTYDGVAYSVTSIGKDAFFICTSLTAITLPEGVTSIGKHAFSSCTSLTSITLPEGVTSIGDYAFQYCSSLTAITIPESVTSIGVCAFSSCSSLTAITLPEGVTSIGSSAFEGCSGLTAIVVAEGNEVYDSRGDCNAIIETASNVLIAGCSTTIIPESVTSIGSSAFSGCTSLTAINIPESVTSIGGCAFYECSSLTAINIPESVTSIGSGAFYGCNNLTSITLPESVTSIGSSAFYGCSSLTAITLPEGVTSIGDYAFDSCTSLTAITIPEGVTSIGDWAFFGCTSLTDVYCHAATVPSTNTDAFDGSNIENATLHVPASAINSYKATAPWSSFGTIVCLTDEETGIENPESRNKKSEITFDLRGRRVATPTKDGIYIVDGKKVMVKTGM